MKFRTLGVALLMGSGLALSAVAASPAVAQPYPPAGCAGPFGTGAVTPATIEIGGVVTFTGCGLEPGSTIQIAIDGVPFATIVAEPDGTFSIELSFDALGQETLTATGQQALSLLLAAAPTGLAAGTDAVPAQDPYLTRVVSANVLVTEKHDWPDDGGWDHGGGGWGEPSGGPSGYPSGDPSGYPSDDPSGYPSGDPSGDPSGYPTDDPTGYPSAAPSGAPSAAQSVAPIERVTPPHHARPPHHDHGLPFTGIETGALAAIAVALVGGGLLIRVAARKRRNVGGTHS